MSKFKVGDKVWCNGDIKTIARIDKWRDGEYGYYFNIDDELLNYYEEEDLELYKTPHERLLELGWRFEYKDEHTTVYYGKNSFTTIKIYHKHFTIGVNFYFGLELAEVLVDYLKELRDE